MVRPLAHPALPVMLAALLLPACGGKSSSGEHDRNEGGSTAGGGAASNAGSASSGGQPNKCDQFPNEPGWSVLVRLINGTKSALYLGQAMPGCGIGTLFDVRDTSGMTLYEPQGCASTCQDVAQGLFTSCPPIPCIVNSVITLQPGEAFQQLWSGSYLKDETLPDGCPAGWQGTDCVRVAAIEPGTFTFAAAAGTAIDCSPFGDACTPCMVDVNGGCTTYGAVIAGPQRFALTSPELDGTYGVGPNGAQPRPVDLIFQE